MTTFNPLTDFFQIFNPNTYTNTNTATTVNFGCNVEDRPTEQYVVDSVGSYGSQLNRVLDVLSVIVNHVEQEQKDLGKKDELFGSKLEPEDKRKIEAFKKLACKADHAAKRFELQMNQQSIDKFLSGMHSLRDSDSSLDQRLYELFKKQVIKEL